MSTATIYAYYEPLSIVDSCSSSFYSIVVITPNFDTRNAIYVYTVKYMNNTHNVIIHFSLLLFFLNYNCRLSQVIIVYNLVLGRRDNKLLIIRKKEDPC